MADEVADFSGWATKANIQCSDGRTILPDAFASQDGQKVPLVWQHGHHDPGLVLGHVYLENRPEGTYAKAYFNNSTAGQNAKEAVAHKDITAMSIYANQLVENAKRVIKGKIKEVSLVLAGANPGALIENVAIQHGENEYTILDGAARIFTGLEFEVSDSISHAANPNDPDGDGDDDSSEAGDTDGDAEELNAQKIWDSMTPEQQSLVEALVSAAAGEAAHSDESDDEDEEEGEDSEEEETTEEQDGEAAHEDGDDEQDPNTDDEGDLEHMEGNNMPTHNAFDKDGNKLEGPTLSHADVKSIFTDALQTTKSLKTSVEQYAIAHGIDDIGALFPEVKSVTETPEFLSRRMAWVASVIDGTRKTPFARIKSLAADLTLEDARAKGYITGALKREEFFKVSKRVTYPQTVYKKQKLDRDDIVDITDFDVVMWLKAELQVMLQEEIARAILIGDGRSMGDEDKINEENIRSIANDDEFYTTTINVAISNGNWDAVVDSMVRERKHYRGSGNPVFYTTDDALANMLLVKDSLGRRIYPDVPSLAVAMRVSDIVPVEAMDSDAYAGLIGVLVNLQDYTVGTNQGGQLNLFDFFDIDYNQFKYLLETRMSGALTKPKSAMVFRQVTATVVNAVKPTVAANVVTIPTVTGVVYSAVDAAGNAVAPVSGKITLDATTLPQVTVSATADTGYALDNNDQDWTYKFKA